MPVVTDGFALVPPPAIQPPVTGLIATLADPALGGSYLVDDTGLVIDDGTGRAMDAHPNRWETGLRYLPEKEVGSGGVTDPCNVATMNISPNEATVAAKPVLVYTGDACSTFGFLAHDYRGRAERLLLAAESKQIAHELWSGTQTRASGWPNPILAGQPGEVLTPDVISTGPQDPIVGLQMMEDALAWAGHGQQSLIHCTRSAIIAWATANAVIRREGYLILTPSNTIIVGDGGYDGSGPASENYPAARSGSVWIYGSPMVTVRRSPIEVIPSTFREATRRDTNLVSFRAERLAVATFNPSYLFACELNLPRPATLGAS